ncbi:MAG: hypothetical protein WCP55_08920 [Lentisphaerota bacterium]
MTAEADIPGKSRALRAGFKFGNNGPHSSRTMMLPEVSRCLDILPSTASRADYRAAILERNIADKSTESSRQETFRRLRELYGLDTGIPLFRLFRELDTLDQASRPLLSLLTVCARDPMLRSTMPTIIGARESDTLGAGDFDRDLERAFPGYQKPKLRAATARHISSTWTQSGHLQGKKPKTRVRVTARPAALALALMLGTFEDIYGAELFRTPWCQVLDLNAIQAQSLAAQCHREGLLDMRAVGSVVEISFPRFAEAMNTEGGNEPL